MSNEQGTMKDSIIELFVQASNKHDFSLDITLNVNGAVITGTMVSVKEYLNSLSETFEEGNEVAQKLCEQFVQASEAVDSKDNSEAQFIHLKNTKVYLGDSKPTPSRGKILWRGKLSEIDGFFLGKISENSTN